MVIYKQAHLTDNQNQDLRKEGTHSYDYTISNFVQYFTENKKPASNSLK